MEDIESIVSAEEEKMKGEAIRKIDEYLKELEAGENKKSEAMLNFWEVMRDVFAESDNPGDFKDSLLDVIEKDSEDFRKEKTHSQEDFEREKKEAEAKKRAVIEQIRKLREIQGEDENLKTWKNTLKRTWI